MQDYILIGYELTFFQSQRCHLRPREGGEHGDPCQLSGLPAFFFGFPRVKGMTMVCIAEDAFMSNAYITMVPPGRLELPHLLDNRF